jgi:RNA polymerase sigma-70 factor (ECF subfamily)
MAPDIHEAFEQCVQRYPAIDLPFDAYRIRVQQIQHETSEVPAHCEDLYLAVACARGDRIAWEYFADQYLPVLRRLAVQACRNVAAGEDVAQDLVRALMEDRQKLASYNGRGSLAAWLRVAVARAAIDRFRRNRREVSLEEIQEHGEKHAGLTRPEARQRDEMPDARWGSVLSEVLTAEIRKLMPRDRLLLALYYVQGVTLKAIAAQFHVHESTVSRWIDGLRDNIRKKVEREMRRRHGLRPHELESVWEFAAEAGGLRVEEALK